MSPHGWTAIALGAVAVLLFTACSPPGANRPTGTLQVVDDDVGSERCLIVFLPGIGDSPEHYQRHGFVEALRRARVDADLRLVDSHFGYYREKSLVTRMEADVLADADAYDEVWLVGISLGGLGALVVAAEVEVDGLILLAPYLGEEPTLAAVGVSSFPERVPDLEPPFDRVWGLLADPPMPIQLAFGEADRYARGHRLAARALHSRDVLVGAGGHRWTVWSELWRAILESGRLQRACGRTP